MKKLLILSILLLSIFIGYKMNFNKVENSRTLVFGAIEIPFSSDPIDYDYFIHHHAFTSVLGRLVSLEKNAEVVPVLAESWESLNDNRIWKFKFRTNLTYSNGEAITIDHYARSLKRMCFLKKNKNSKSGLLEFLTGYDTLSSMSDDIEGIKINGDYLILNFTKPMPDLLSKISFGFYSLAHPSLYDDKTGVWKNKREVISSGPYEVVKWDKVNFEIVLRDNLPYVNYENSVRKVVFKEFVFYITAKEMSTIDFFIADKNSLMVDDSFEFIGIENGLKIGYVRCHSWNREGSALKSKAVRKWFRSKFYEGLERDGLLPTKNFFPSSLVGIETIVDNEKVSRPDFEPTKLLTHTMSFSLKTTENSHKKSIAEIFQSGLINLGNNSGAQLIQEDSDYSKHDIEINGTGIEYDNYLDTVRFMFLSKDGIQLPDENGKILNELKKENPNVNVINREIWDQAIIWPIRHYNSGFWFNKNSEINYSAINFNSPAIDFQFIKWL